MAVIVRPLAVWIVFLVASAAVLLFPFEAFAASSSGAREAAAKQKISNLAFARLLIKAGRYRDARVFLEQARPVSEEGKIEKRFLLGKVYMRLGMPRKAVEQFEAILVIRPDLTRVRLELASAQYAAGFDEKAKRHFELSLADGLPSSVENAVEGFIHAIDARKRWSLHLSAALLPETNAVRRTGNRTVQIGGATFRLNEDAREAPGVGVQLAAGAAFSPRIADDVRGHFALSSAAKLYEKSQWNDISLIGEAGLTRLFDSGALSGGLRLGRRWAGSEGFQSSVGPWMSFERRTSRRVRIRFRTNVDYRHHDERDDLDGWRVTVNPSIRYALDSRTVLEAGPFFDFIEARKDHRSSRLVGLSGGVSRALKNGVFI
ncbi:MAG: tetratricopeptide repeat protein, partial [Nitrospinae bacterium]|nr:tetratricopeptide repeat protein [Nitrospinota bacterium]